MSRIIDKGLEEQSVMLCRMGELTYDVVALSIEGYLNGTRVQARVREMSEILTAMSNEVEDKTFELIARFQPVASDLRTIKSYMKIAYDFARCGRYALDISYISERLGGLTECEAWIRQYVADMSDKVLTMVQTSVNALKSHNPELAQTVSKTEEEVDAMYFGFLDKLVQDARATNQCTISSVLVIRYLERIADHAIYVTEAIIYIATGKKLALG
jgi:phosphate transport system protein